MINIIRIRIRIRSKIYKKNDIGDIRPYPIRFHPLTATYVYSWMTDELITATYGRVIWKNLQNFLEPNKATTTLIMQLHQKLNLLITVDPSLFGLLWYHAYKNPGNIFMDLSLFFFATSHFFLLLNSIYFSIN